jgi:hypothetical protein
MLPNLLLQILPEKNSEIYSKNSIPAYQGYQPIQQPEQTGTRVLVGAQSGPGFPDRYSLPLGWLSYDMQSDTPPP